MSRTVVRTMTVPVGDDDVDCPVRATFEVAGHETILDGAIEALVAGEWVPVAELYGPVVRRHALGRIEDILAEQAMDDERDAFSDIDPDEYGVAS